MKDYVIKAVTKHQANETLSAGSVNALFSHYLTKYLKKPLN
ncbi:hypothetical protein [Xenorhabdus kozodoii]|nr:hypothetical protein [Xenorhabdus kozodoii]